MSKKSVEIGHIIELFRLSNEYDEGLEPYEVLVKIFKMEHLAQLHKPQEIIPLILDRYAYILKMHGKTDPLMVVQVQDNQVVNQAPAVKLCNMCFKQATHTFTEKISICNEHADDLKMMSSYFEGKKEC